MGSSREPRRSERLLNVMRLGSRLHHHGKHQTTNASRVGKGHVATGLLARVACLGPRKSCACVATPSLSRNGGDRHGSFASQLDRNALLGTFGSKRGLMWMLV